MIKVLIVDEHQLVCDGIRTVLQLTDDIRVIDCVSGLRMLMPGMKALDSHILLINIYQVSDSHLAHIQEICKNYPKVKVLINAMFDSEHFLLQTIKAGASGYLTKDDGANELKEAIYTLRNGYEYNGRSISNLLLSHYLKQHAGDQKGLEQLTRREKEVIRLFASSKTNKEIADALSISIRTVETHKSNVMKKINLKTTVDLVKFAIKNNIIRL